MPNWTDVDCGLYQIIHQQEKVGQLARSVSTTDISSRLKKKEKIAILEAANKTTDKEKLVGSRKLGEGDLFGARALEHGYFGGVAQSRSNSPSPSYVLSPDTTVVDWSSSDKLRNFSAASSVVDFPRSGNTSVSSLPIGADWSTRKPSPLRLQPSDAELSGRINHDPSSVGGKGGAYMPPLPSPLSERSALPAFISDTRPAGWVNPLDVHFSRPTTPASSRPQSPQSFQLPKLDFPGGLEKNGLIMPTPSGSINGVRSDAASIVSSEVSAPNPAPVEPPKTKSPTFSVFPQSRAARQTRSIFPVNDERPVSSRGPKESPESIPPLPLNDLPPRILTIDPSQFPQDNRQWNPASPIIRDSIVTKQRVSIYQPSQSHDTFPDALKSRGRAHSVAASSIYSSRTSILDEPTSNSHTQSRSRSPQSQIRPRQRSRSSSHKRSSSHGLSRTQDSLRRHSRKISQESLRSRARRSRDRDQMHFDPTQQQRNRSGSVQGRKVDFDHPRESPFSNSNATTSHSGSTSISSSISTTSSTRTRSRSRGGEKQDPMPKPPVLAVHLPEQGRLSVDGFGRGRSASEASQGSIGEFYDSYYRQSTMAQRASVVAQAQNSGMLGVANFSHPKRPGALNLRLGGGNVDTIVEMPSPLASPMVAKERYPGMI
jgi:hypothetical protein